MYGNRDVPFERKQNPPHQWSNQYLPLNEKIAYVPYNKDPYIHTFNPTYSFVPKTAEDFTLGPARPGGQPGAAWGGVNLDPYPATDTNSPGSLREFQGINPPTEVMGQPKAAAEGWWGKTKKWLWENKRTVLAGTAIAAVAGSILYVDLGARLKKYLKGVAEKYENEAHTHIASFNVEDYKKLKQSEADLAKNQIKEYNSMWYDYSHTDLSLKEYATQTLLHLFEDQNCYNMARSPFSNCDILEKVLGDRKFELMETRDLAKELHKGGEGKLDRGLYFITTIKNLIRDRKESGGVIPKLDNLSSYTYR